MYRKGINKINKNLKRLLIFLIKTAIERNFIMQTVLILLPALALKGRILSCHLLIYKLINRNGLLKRIFPLTLMDFYARHDTQIYFFPSLSNTEVTP